MSLSAHRPVLATLRHSAHAYRLVHSSTPLRATALTSSSFPPEHVEAFDLPRIFDIFDAPVRLGESSKQLREQIGFMEERPRVSAFNGPRPRLVPSSLPPPIIFDGPARPRHLPPALQTRRLTMRSRPVVRTVQPSPLPPTPEPLVQLFEGPARLMPYCPPNRSKTQFASSSSNQLFLLCVVGALGSVVFAKSPDLNGGSFDHLGHSSAETIF